LNKVDFYRELLNDIRHREIRGEMLENELLRRNLTSFCNLCKKTEYGNIVRKIEEMNTNDFCWYVYIILYENVINEYISEEEKEKLKLEYRINKALYKIGILDNFTCIHTQKIVWMM